MERPRQLVRIHWSAAHGRRGLFAERRLVDPAWFTDGGGLPDGEGWTLVCEFVVPPAEQGNPSEAWARFLMEDAPHERLRPGAVLSLFERETQLYARVEVLESPSRSAV